LYLSWKLISKYTNKFCIFTKANNICIALKIKLKLMRIKQLNITLTPETAGVLVT